MNTANLKILVDIIRELDKKRLYNILANEDEGLLILDNKYFVCTLNYDINLTENDILKIAAAHSRDFSRE